MKKITLHVSLITLLLTIITCSTVNAQLNIDGDSSNIRVQRDFKLDLLQSRFNKTQEERGYRIQIHSSLRKEQARKTKSQFLMLYPKTSCYETYNQPYFNVKVGDFLTKLEAQCFLNELREEFPNAFIVPEVIYPLGIVRKK